MCRAGIVSPVNPVETLVNVYVACENGVIEDGQMESLYRSMSTFPVFFYLANPGCRVISGA